MNDNEFIFHKNHNGKLMVTYQPVDYSKATSAFVSLSNKGGIIRIKNYSMKTEHSCHPNIDASESISEMIKNGYWKKNNKTTKIDGFIYNISKKSISDNLDKLCLFIEENPKLTQKFMDIQHFLENTANNNNYVYINLDSEGKIFKAHNYSVCADYFAPIENTNMYSLLEGEATLEEFRFNLQKWQLSIDRSSIFGEEKYKSIILLSSNQTDDINGFAIGYSGGNGNFELSYDLGIECNRKNAHEKAIKYISNFYKEQISYNSKQEIKKANSNKF